MFRIMSELNRLARGISRTCHSSLSRDTVDSDGVIKSCWRDQDVAVQVLPVVWPYFRKRLAVRRRGRLIPKVTNHSAIARPQVSGLYPAEALSFDLGLHFSGLSRHRCHTEIGVISVKIAVDRQYPNSTSRVLLLMSTAAAGSLFRRRRQCALQLMLVMACCLRAVQ